MNCNIAVIKGDGIGPEVVTEAMKVLDAVGKKFGHTFNYEQLLMGGCSIDLARENDLDSHTACLFAKLRRGTYPRFACSSGTYPPFLRLCPLQGTCR